MGTKDNQDMFKHVKGFFGGAKANVLLFFWFMESFICCRKKRRFKCKNHICDLRSALLPSVVPVSIQYASPSLCVCSRFQPEIVLLRLADNDRIINISNVYLFLMAALRTHTRYRAGKLVDAVSSRRVAPCCCVLNRGNRWLISESMPMQESQTEECTNKKWSQQVCLPAPGHRVKDLCLN